MRFPRLWSFLNYRISRSLSWTLILPCVGVGLWILKSLLFQPNVRDWLHLQPDVLITIARGLGFCMWVVAGGACLGLLNLISMAPDFLRAAIAMWRPGVVLFAAGYLLFFNDQGRELGISLMGEDYGWPLFFLFFALCYWAANSWHTARLGIHSALERGVFGVPPAHPEQLRAGSPDRHVVTGKERWLYWPPRLLGVFAHLFAAINLSLAAWRLPPAAWDDPKAQWLLGWLSQYAPAPIVALPGWLSQHAPAPVDALPGWFSQHTPALIDALRWFAWSAPLSILLATAVVWAGDVTCSSRGRACASERKMTLARRVGVAAILGEIPLVGGLLFFIHPQIASMPDVASQGVPQGFVWGNLVIILSAVVFLGLISWMRDRSPIIGAAAAPEIRAADDRRQRKEIEFFTIGLSLVAFCVGLAVWISATFVGRFLGSMVVAYFAFGAILALVNAIEFAVEFASKCPTRKQWFGEWATSRGLGVGVVAFAIVFGVVNAWLHPFHRVRLCDGDCKPGMSPGQRPTVRETAGAWYLQAESAYRQAGHKGPVPLLIVATAGGGIRAAYWTATVLEKLEDDFENEGGVHPYLFAISGVSGGSVGAMDFDAALARREENQCKTSKEGDKDCPRATDFLKEDFLAPALASLVFQDAPSSFLPDLGQGDRGAALERSFEHASYYLLARPFLSFFPLIKTQTSWQLKQGQSWRPLLLLNATHEETGNRIITSHVLIERNVFVDSLDALAMLRGDVRASTAAHNSARFTYVSPAGNLGSDQGSVIDGGYFENFGALSALELARAATAALKDKTPNIRLVILMISSDPDLNSNHMLVRINESATHPKKCLVSVAEREAPRSSPNYFSVDPTGVENALVNEFFAPFQGLEKVREAHGNWSAAELAVDVCTEINFNLPASNETKMNTLDLSKDVNADGLPPYEANAESPYFAHLAMCETAPIQPPLGWMLSNWTQEHFPDLLQACGNKEQLTQLETALGAKPQQKPAEQPSERLGER
jgi:hypothetical protein